MTVSSAVSDDQPREFRQFRFTPPPGACELLLVRHGESQPARPGESFTLVDGHGDPPLHSQGEAEAEKVAERLKDVRIDAVYVTTLQRTGQTAAPLLRHLDVEPRVEPDLREVFLGDWEGGLLRQKVVEGDPVAVRLYTERRWDVIPNAEPSDTFETRVRAAVTRIAEAHPNERVAVFTHGGVIGQIMAIASEGHPFAFSGADNGSISQIVVHGARWMLRRFNDTSHLDDTYTAAGQPLT